MLIVNNPELITPLDKCWFCSSTLIVTYHKTEKRWCHNGCFWNLMLSELVVLLISYFATYFFFLFSINVCFMNKIHTTSVMLSLSWYLTVSYGVHKSSPMASWDNNTCTSKSQQKQQIIKIHLVHFAYCFMNTMNRVIWLYSHIVFHLLYSRE